MKTPFLFLTLIFMAFTGYSSHLSSGDIWYKYVGNQTGIANQYQVGITFYAPLSGVSMPNIVSLSVCSSCYPSAAITLTLDSGFIPLPGVYSCVGANAQGSINYYAYHYSTIYTLPGLCANFRFSFSALGRESGIDNLFNSSIQHFQLTAELNNMLGHNSSPAYSGYPQVNFCVGQAVLWKNPVMETDGDSIFYKLSPVLGNSDPCILSPAIYSAGYTATHPLATVGNVPPQFFANTGMLAFTPSSLQFVAIRLEVEEYRTDTLYPTFVKIGSVSRDINVAIVQNCNPIMQGVLYDFAAMQVYAHQNGLPTIDKQCSDTTITLRFANPIECVSIAPNGSDFRLSSPNGQPIPIKRAAGICNSLAETQEVLLTLYSPNSVNGLHVLYSKTGTDGNTLLNSCGFAMFEYDTLQINVSGCSGIGLEEQEFLQSPDIPSAFRIAGSFSILIPETLVGDYQLFYYSVQGSLLFTEMYSGFGNWQVQNMDGLTLPGMYVCKLQSTSNPASQWQQKVLVLP